MDELSGVQAPIKHEGRQGFLPIETNRFDRVFISVVIFVAIGLFWLRFIEVYLPLWIAGVISAIIAYLIIRWG